MKTLSLLALCGSLAIPALAHADTFNYTASASGIGFSGSGTITADYNGTGYVISSITGPGVTGLIAPGGFSNGMNGTNDNMVYPMRPNKLVDIKGFAFTDTMGNTAYDVNLFYNNNINGYQIYLKDSDGDSQYVNANFSLAAQTPEPSSLVLLGTGALGFLGMARRRFVRA